MGEALQLIMGIAAVGTPVCGALWMVARELCGLRHDQQRLSRGQRSLCRRMRRLEECMAGDDPTVCPRPP